MSRNDWRTMLFDYDWWQGPERGFALYADGVAVGFIGTIFSTRLIDGRQQTFCNASSWIVREPFRNASILLLKPILALRDCTLVNLTPNERAYEIFKKFGFKDLESELLLLPPLANPITLRGSFASDPVKVRATLTENQQDIFDKLSTSARVSHIVLRDAKASCYVVATRRFVRGIPIADIHYVSDREFFWSHRGLAHVALLRTLGAVGMAIDRRCVSGDVPKIALHRRALRLYRPAHPETPPEAIDSLFTELLVLRL